MPNARRRETYLMSTRASSTPHEFVIGPGTSGLITAIKELWVYRELVGFFVWKEIKVRYKQTIFGVAWAVLQPLLTMLVFTLFFGVLARLPSDGLPFPVFYFAGLVPWTYFANSVSTATNIMVEQQRVITRVYFPRLVLPLSSVLSGLIDLAIATGVLVVINLAYGFYPTWTLLGIIPFTAVAVALAFAIGIWSSALNALYRDVRYAIPLLVHLWLFASPVAYATSLVPERWQVLYELNPMVTVIEGFRWATTGAGSPPGATAVALALVMIAALMAGGLIYFSKAESRIVDVV